MPLIKTSVPSLGINKPVLFDPKFTPKAEKCDYVVVIDGVEEVCGRQFIPQNKDQHVCIFHMNAAKAQRARVYAKTKRVEAKNKKARGMVVADGAVEAGGVLETVRPVGRRGGYLGPYRRRERKGVGED